MNGFLDDFKNAWNKPNNAVAQIIIINVIVFAILGILRFIVGPRLFGNIYEHFALPAMFNDFLVKPYTIITYAFTHDLSSLWHILMNMLVFYWFGKLVQEYLGSKKVIAIYLLGAIVGGSLYLLVYNLFPHMGNAIMVGASGSVFAIMVAAATLMPDYRFFLLLIGPAKIKYIALVFIFFSFVWVREANTGGNLAHLGGALLGFTFIVQLRNGRDWSKPVIAVIDFFKGLFRKKPKIKVTHKRTVEKKSPAPANHSPVSPRQTPLPDQKEIDAILDKISERGYESLTKEEKEKLFNASRKH